MSAQLRLLPSSPPAQRNERVALDRLDGYADATPSRELRDQLRTLGLLQPIVVVPATGGRLRIVDGRRRAKAIAELAGGGEWREPPEVAVLILAGRDAARGSVPHGLTLALHASRGPSPASELAAIEAILHAAKDHDEAATVKEIAAQTGLSVQTVRRRLRLRALSPELRRVFDRGELPASVAEAAARLPQAQQESFERKLGAGERVTLADVRGVARDQASAAIAALPQGLFVDHELPWQAAVRGHLNAALAAMSHDARQARLGELICDALSESERP